jgi:hypothetical protein
MPIEVKPLIIAQFIIFLFIYLRLLLTVTNLGQNQRGCQAYKLPFYVLYLANIFPIFCI